MEQQYLSHAANILTKGNVRPDRTNTGTRSIFSHVMRHDLQEGFPLLTSKFVSLRLIIEELLWILSGSTNIAPLLEKNVHIWDEWALVDRLERTVEGRMKVIKDRLLKHGALELQIVGETHEQIDEALKAYADMGYEVFKEPGLGRWAYGRKDGELGPVYGAQWRRWSGNKVFIKDVESYIAYGANAEEGMGALKEMLDDAKKDNGIDQIAELIKGLKEKPYSRRHIVSGWNPDDMPDESKSHAENVSNDKQALPPCHTLFQFYVRDMPNRDQWIRKNKTEEVDRVEAILRRELHSGVYASREGFDGDQAFIDRHEELYGAIEVPRLLDCQLYQR